MLVFGIIPSVRMNLLDTWLLVIGALLLAMALLGSVIERMPFTPAILYLGAGYAVGSGGLGLHNLHPVADALPIRVMSEIAVSISLFAVGLKLRAPISLTAWRTPLRLGVPAMILSIALLALAAWLIGFSIGAAIILASILAPTDPVLGADVHVDRPGDRDQVRFGVTAEGGLNDGLAMPGVLLGLGLVGLHEIGPGGLRWLLLEALWLPVGGLLVGWGVGTAVGRLVLYLRHRHGLAVGLEEFLAFGVMGLAFGAAGAVRASTFLSVFAAGLALRHLERRTSAEVKIDPENISLTDESAATDPKRSAAHLTHSLLNFNSQIEHIAEFVLVMVVGGLLASIRFRWEALALAAILFAVARPVAVYASLAGTSSQLAQTRLIAWFGIRGIGSLYYLAYAIAAGLPREEAMRLASIVLIVVALSIVIHGVTAAPLMQSYYRSRTSWRQRRKPNS